MEQERIRRIEHARRVQRLVQELNAGGVVNPQAIAEILNARGIPTVAEKSWTAIEVIRLARRPADASRLPKRKNTKRKPAGPDGGGDAAQ